MKSYRLSSGQMNTSCKKLFIVNDIIMVLVEVVQWEIIIIIISQSIQMFEILNHCNSFQLTTCQFVFCYSSLE